MTNTPLDAPTDFIPSEEERPAGQWMEGYWAATARWAKYFAFAIFGYFSWVTYSDVSQIFSNSNSHTQNGLYFIAELMIPLANIPIALLGFFCFRFSQDLELALAGNNQLLLEKAFQQLQRFLLLGLAIASIGIISAVTQWQMTILFMGQDVPPIDYDYDPINIETIDTLN